MQTRKILVRIIKLLGKVILGLLLVLLIAVALIHLPPVQKKITSEVSHYLSSKIDARVDIQRIKFSILGSVAIEELGVWDPHGNKIFSARKIEVRSSILDLISGDLIFDEVHIEGADGKLTQDEEGLNIQYIIDAFRPAEKQTSSTPTSTGVTLQFKKVHLEKISDNGLILVHSNFERSDTL